MGSCTSQQESSNRIIIQRKHFQSFAIKWNLTKEQIAIAYTLAKKDHFIVSVNLTTEDQMKCFLYAKNILDEDPVIREHTLKKLFSKKKDGPYERLNRIVCIGEQAREDVSSFDIFVNQNPQWGPGKSWVLFRDHVLLASKNAYVQRTQLSSLCYMHGPVVMQHYLVAMNSQEKIGMVDISDYLRKHMDSESLKNHLYENQGGHSIEFLRNLLRLENHETLEKPDIKSNDVPKFLEKFGPGLISSMEIWSCFYDQSKWIHLGKPSGKMKGHHSMILIGYRNEGPDIRLLLQNWWNFKTFVEVDTSYLRACGAVLTFCNTPHKSIPSTFETNFNRHVETSLDKCEYLPLEEKKRVL